MIIANNLRKSVFGRYTISVNKWRNIMASITSLGIGSGLDLNGLLNQLNTAERSRLKPIQDSIAKEQVRISGYGQFKSALSDLSDVISRLKDPETFNSKTVEVDGESLSASVSDGTLDATYDINVTQLATRGNVTTNGFDSKTDDVTSTDSEIVIKFNQEDDITLNIAANSSLEDIRDEINNNVEGVKSSILFDGSQYRLTLSSEETGSKGSISSVEIVDIMNTEVSNVGQDASFTANGISITSPTNTIDGAIEGLTMNLNSLGSSSLTIKNDDSLIKDALTQFVESYNGFKDRMDKLTAFDVDSGSSGSLNGEYTVRSVSNQLSRMISSTSGNERIDMLADLGISITNDGRLEIDENKLDNEIGVNKDNIVSFLTNEDYGFANKMGDMIDKTLNSTGIISNAITSSENRIEDLRDRYTRLESNIEKNIDRYRTQFQQLDSMIAQMSQTSNYLNQQLNLLRLNNE